MNCKSIYQHFLSYSFIVSTLQTVGQWNAGESNENRVEKCGESNFSFWSISFHMKWIFNDILPEKVEKAQYLPTTSGIAAVESIVPRIVLISVRVVRKLVSSAEYSSVNGVTIWWKIERREYLYNNAVQERRRRQCSFDKRIQYSLWIASFLWSSKV